MTADKEPSSLGVMDASDADPRDLPEVRALQDIGRLFYENGWSRGTSSNYSCVLYRNPLRLLITASGKDKRNLSTDDFLIVDDSGKRVSHGDQKPSAETMLHIAAIAAMPDVGAVLHTHSVWSTLLSDFYELKGGFNIQGYEMLKGLEGIRSHEEKLRMEIFGNSQNIPELAQIVSQRLSDETDPLKYGYLIARHGLYTWGRTIEEARRHVEIFEFLFEVLGRKLYIKH